MGEKQVKKVTNAYLGAGNGKLSVLENGQFKIFQKNSPKFKKKNFFQTKKVDCGSGKKKFFFRQN